MMKKSISLILLATVLMSACNSSDNKPQGETDTPTSGSITIGADPTLQPLANSEATSFETICPKAHIRVLALDEGKAFEYLQKDSVRLIIASREPNEDENNFFQSKKMKLRVNKIAKDGVAFITNQANPDTISYQNIIDILTGKITKWNEWGSKLDNKDIQIVFDNANSSTVKSILKHTGGILQKNVSALDNNQNVIEYIKKNKHAIGIIGLNWISDGRDQTTGSFYEGFRVMGINPADTSKHHGNYFKPFQAYLLYEAYPFSRIVYTINADPKDGLGTGFVSHVCSQKGQAVVQQGGLLPMAQRAWIREVEIKK